MLLVGEAAGLRALLDVGPVTAVLRGDLTAVASARRWPSARRKRFKKPGRTGTCW